MNAVPKPQQGTKPGQRSWTDAQRAQQAAKLRTRQIWLTSTGPRTDEGKRISSQNALKHGRFTEESKSIRTWLCFMSRNIKFVKRTLRHYEFMQRHSFKKISQNELIALEHKMRSSSTFSKAMAGNIIPFQTREPPPIETCHPLST